MTDRLCLGFDTSNYTTSACYYDGVDIVSAERLLPVGEGELGLRQSDAVFHHTRALPELIETLGTPVEKPRAVGASDRPREAEGSYMPCFLVGVAMARGIAATLGVPCLFFSHQQDHVAAAAYSAGHPELLDRPFLAWHLSGGTTELLLVKPQCNGVTCRRIGGTTDISAGQLLDRTGHRLNIRFPAGKTLDGLAQNGVSERFRVRVNASEFSFSGMENKLNDLIATGAGAETVAAYALNTIAEAVKNATEQAFIQHGDMPVLFSGGVSGSTVLRKALSFGIFPQPRYASDNALGTAILTYRAVTG